MSYYYNIENILCEEEKIPIKFEIEGAETALFEEQNTNSTSNMMFADSQPTELPFWLAYELGLEHFVSLGLPSTYKERASTHLRADPAAVSLRRSPFYYALGFKLSDGTVPFASQEDEEAAQELPNTLTQVFRARFLRIVDEAVNWRHEDAGVFAARLVTLEEQLFRDARRAAVSLEKWRNRKEEKINAAPSTGMKRKNRD